MFGMKNDDPILFEITGLEVIKLFFMLNSAEHEVLNAHEY